jgi:uncharacterized metal-binding protein
MEETCGCPAHTALLLPCSGASNLGQIANRTALELRAEGYGRMYCTVGVGAHIQSMIRAVKEAPCLVAIDGCEVSCVKKLLDHLDIRPHRHVVVSRLGIDKNFETSWPSEHVARVKEAVRGPAEDLPPKPSAAPGEQCCK